MNYCFSPGVHFFDGEEYLSRQDAVAYANRSYPIIWKAASNPRILRSIKLGCKRNSPIFFSRDDLDRLYGNNGIVYCNR